MNTPAELETFSPKMVFNMTYKNKLTKEEFLEWLNIHGYTSFISDWLPPSDWFDEMKFGNFVISEFYYWLQTNFSNDTSHNDSKKGWWK